MLQNGWLKKQWFPLTWPNPGYGHNTVHNTVQLHHRWISKTFALLYLKGTHARDFIVRFSGFFGIIQ
jgi:hypothetical protein